MNFEAEKNHLVSGLICVILRFCKIMYFVLISYILYSVLCLKIWFLNYRFKRSLH